MSNQTATATEKHIVKKELEHTFMRGASTRECMEASQKYAEAHTQQSLSDLTSKVEQIKEKCLDLSFDERDDMEGVISEIDVKICFEEILTLIEEELQ